MRKNLSPHFLFHLGKLYWWISSYSDTENRLEDEYMYGILVVFTIIVMIMIYIPTKNYLFSSTERYPIASSDIKRWKCHLMKWEEFQVCSHIYGCVGGPTRQTPITAAIETIRTIRTIRIQTTRHPTSVIRRFWSRSKNLRIHSEFRSRGILVNFLFRSGQKLC